MLRFRRLSIISMIATLLLVAVGGLVRATNSGLGCGDDWPVCNGKVIPLFDNYTVAIEFSHRFVAGVIIVTLALLVWAALREHRARPRLIKASVAALGLVMFQAVLGAVVVKLDLKAESVVMHLLVAMLLLGLLVYVAMAASAAEGKLETTRDEHVSKLAWWVAGSVLALLLVGSYVSGREAGLAFTDWPLMDGSLVPDLGHELRAVQFFHRVLAAVVGAGVLVFAASILRRPSAPVLETRLARAAAALFVIEVMIGAFNVWTRLNAGIVTLHLAVGAAIWGCLVALAVATGPALASEVGVYSRREEALEPVS